jgi:hypothetical protein
LVGFLYEPILILSSFGLGTLMLIGLVVRIRLKDNLKVSLPAFFLYGAKLWYFLYGRSVKRIVFRYPIVVILNSPRRFTTKR